MGWRAIGRPRMKAQDWEVGPARQTAAEAVRRTRRQGCAKLSISRPTFLPRLSRASSFFSTLVFRLADLDFVSRDQLRKETCRHGTSECNCFGGGDSQCHCAGWGFRFTVLTSAVRGIEWCVSGVGYCGFVIWERILNSLRPLAVTNRSCSQYLPTI
jgi:hypothetical protein